MILGKICGYFHSTNIKSGNKLATADSSTCFAVCIRCVVVRVIRTMFKVWEEIKVLYS